ncbi:hypothetical protein [Sunxiuqinia dokdonensis]|uniref:Uncharacterized protein n=1 Tax=Sunxiuqinia dokdonensis TaxID=1409788 RepID=A0A0L8VEW3_9BACT|nr:hypothetical protein [Sunxiuqinia dokdonensis]KOH47006.1 hypothetical protein NC99_01840 [Sunxiuqinia dokdonensis]
MPGIGQGAVSWQIPNQVRNDASIAGVPLSPPVHRKVKAAQADPECSGGPGRRWLVGGRMEFSRFFPPFYRLLERSGNPDCSGEKEVPVRHKDMEALTIKQTFCDAAHAGWEHSNTK